MRVSVVVVTYNSAADLKGLLPTLAASATPAVRTTVVVVDNGSSDDSVSTAESSPHVDLVIRAENRGYAAGINAGAAAAADFDALLVLNPDVRLHDDALQEMVAATHDPEVGIVAPRLVDARGATLWSQRREPSLARTWAEAIVGGTRAGRAGETERRPERYERTRTVDWATGAALLVTRRCWDAVGPWDAETFFMYSEETDFCLRARDHGFATRFVPAAVAAHLEGDMTSPTAAAMRSVSAARLYRKRHGKPATIAYIGGLLAGSALRATRPSERAAALALLAPGRRPGQVRHPSLLTRRGHDPG